MNTLNPLTPEARETVERIRRLNYWRKAPVGELLSIIDNLPAPKQYTEEELRAEFENGANKHYYNLPADFRRINSGLEYTDPRVWVSWEEWKRCARHFGLIKQEDQVQCKHEFIADSETATSSAYGICRKCGHKPTRGDQCQEK